MKYQPADYCKGSDKFSSTFGASTCPVCGQEYASTQAMRVRRHLAPEAKRGNLSRIEPLRAVDVCGPNAGKAV